MAITQMKSAIPIMSDLAGFAIEVTGTSCSVFTFLLSVVFCFVSILATIGAPHTGQNNRVWSTSLPQSGQFIILPFSPDGINSNIES